MNDEKSKVVTLRPKRDRNAKKDISKEPEIIELRRLIRDGELDKDRTIEHLQSGEEPMNKIIGEIQTIDRPKIKVKIVATLEEQKSGTWIQLTQHNKIDDGHWIETNFKILFRVEAWEDFKKLVAKVDRAIGKKA
jgi:hypothetical protein